MNDLLLEIINKSINNYQVYLNWRTEFPMQNVSEAAIKYLNLKGLMRLS